MKKALFLGVLFVFNLLHAENAKDKELSLLTNGWYTWAPYQFEQENHGFKNLVGLDVDLVKFFTKQTGRDVEYTPVSWKQHQLDLKSGKRHFAAGATYTEERSKFVYFSEPYRFEENSMYMKREMAANFSLTDGEGDKIANLIQQIQEKNLTIAVIDGFIYADPRINSFIADPKNAKHFIKTGDDLQSMKLVVSGKADAFMADRLVGANVIWRNKTGSVLAEVPLDIKTPIHFMFSKASVPLSVVKEFNVKIKQAEETGATKELFTKYMGPILFLQTVESPWFRLLDLLGTFAFALSGILIAFEKRSTLLAAVFFAFLPSFGGGVIRDVVFDISPIHILRSPYYFIIVLSVVLGAYLVSFLGGHRLSRFFDSLLPKFLKNKGENPYLMLTDAVGLGAFTIAGIFVTLEAEASPIWLWGPFFATITGAGGGILRDIIARRDKIMALSGTIYAELAVIWGFFMSVYISVNALEMTGEMMERATIITVVGVVISRILVSALGLRNLFFR